MVQYQFLNHSDVLVNANTILGIVKPAFYTIQPELLTSAEDSAI